MFKITFRVKKNTAIFLVCPATKSKRKLGNTVWEKQTLNKSTIAKLSLLKALFLAVHVKELPRFIEQDEKVKEHNGSLFWVFHQLTQQRQKQILSRMLC